jgi:hypothetical protein
MIKKLTAVSRAWITRLLGSRRPGLRGGSWDRASVGETGWCKEVCWQVGAIALVVLGTSGVVEARDETTEEFD